MFISLAFRKMHKAKGCCILKIMLVVGFCSLKVEIAQFPIEFWLIIFSAFFNVTIVF